MRSIWRMLGWHDGSGKDVTEKDVVGLKYFRQLLPLLERLHDVGCARDKAGNRTLIMDQYCALVLLFLFNPIVRSLRSIQQAANSRTCRRSSAAAGRRSARCPKRPTSSIPSGCKAIIGELGEQLQPLRGRPAAGGPRAHGHAGRRHAAEGAAADRRSDVAEHAHRHGRITPGGCTRTSRSTARADCGSTSTDGRNSGKTDEKTVLRQHLRSRPLLRDGPLVRPVHAVQRHRSRRQQLRLPRPRQQRLRRRRGAAAVGRGASQRACSATRSCALGLSKKADRAARPSGAGGAGPHDAARQARRNRKGNTGAGPSDGVLRIATNLLDVPAEIIALIYQYRWTIELFFRFFKHVLGCRHLLSDDPRRHRDPDLLRDHRLPADQPVDRPQADAADLRDDLLLLHGLGRRRRTAGPSGEAEKTRRLTRSAAIFSTSAEPLHRCANGPDLVLPACAGHLGSRSSTSPVECGTHYIQRRNNPPQSSRRTGLGRELFFGAIVWCSLPHLS